MLSGRPRSSVQVAQKRRSSGANQLDAWGLYMSVFLVLRLFRRTVYPDLNKLQEGVARNVATYQLNVAIREREQLKEQNKNAEKTAREVLQAHRALDKHQMQLRLRKVPTGGPPHVLQIVSDCF